MVDHAYEGLGIDHEAVASAKPWASCDMSSLEPGDAEYPRQPALVARPAPLRIRSAIRRMSAAGPVPSVRRMTGQSTRRRVGIRFVAPPPGQRIERATGVSDVEIDGPVLRCVVTGSVQPLLEALRGHEVIGLESTPTDERRRTAP